MNELTHGNEDNRNHRDPFNPEPTNDREEMDEQRDNVIHLPGAQAEPAPRQDHSSAAFQTQVFCDWICLQDVSCQP